MLDFEYEVVNHRFSHGNLTIDKKTKRYEVGIPVVKLSLDGVSRVEQRQSWERHLIEASARNDERNAP